MRVGEARRRAFAACRPTWPSHEGGWADPLSCLDACLGEFGGESERRRFQAENLGRVAWKDCSEPLAVKGIRAVCPLHAGAVSVHPGSCDASTTSASSGSRCGGATSPNSSNLAEGLSKCSSSSSSTSFADCASKDFNTAESRGADASSSSLTHATLQHSPRSSQLRPALFVSPQVLAASAQNAPPTTKSAAETSLWRTTAPQKLAASAECLDASALGSFAPGASSAGESHLSPTAGGVGLSVSDTGDGGDLCEDSVFVLTSAPSDGADAETADFAAEGVAAAVAEEGPTRREPQSREETSGRGAALLGAALCLRGDLRLAEVERGERLEDSAGDAATSGVSGSGEAQRVFDSLSAACFPQGRGLRVAHPEGAPGRAEEGQPDVQRQHASPSPFVSLVGSQLPSSSSGLDCCAPAAASGGTDCEPSPASARQRLHAAGLSSPQRPPCFAPSSLFAATPSPTRCISALSPEQQSPAVSCIQQTQQQQPFVLGARSGGLSHCGFHEALPSSFPNPSLAAVSGCLLQPFCSARSATPSQSFHPKRRFPPPQHRAATQSNCLRSPFTEKTKASASSSIPPPSLLALMPLGVRYDEHKNAFRAMLRTSEMKVNKSFSCKKYGPQKALQLAAAAAAAKPEFVSASSASASVVKTFPHLALKCAPLEGNGLCQVASAQQQVVRSHQQQQTFFQTAASQQPHKHQPQQQQSLQLSGVSPRSALAAAGGGQPSSFVASCRQVFEAPGGSSRGGTRPSCLRGNSSEHAARTSPCLLGRGCCAAVVSSGLLSPHASVSAPQAFLPWRGGPPREVCEGRCCCDLCPRDSHGAVSLAEGHLSPEERCCCFLLGEEASVQTGRLACCHGRQRQPQPQQLLGRVTSQEARPLCSEGVCLSPPLLPNTNLNARQCAVVPSTKPRMNSLPLRESLVMLENQETTTRNIQGLSVKAWRAEKEANEDRDPQGVSAQSAFASSSSSASRNRRPSLSLRVEEWENSSTTQGTSELFADQQGWERKRPRRHSCPSEKIKRLLGGEAPAPAASSSSPRERGSPSPSSSPLFLPVFENRLSAWLCHVATAPGAVAATPLPEGAMWIPVFPLRAFGGREGARKAALHWLRRQRLLETSSVQTAQHLGAFAQEAEGLEDSPPREEPAALACVSSSRGEDVVGCVRVLTEETERTAAEAVSSPASTGDALEALSLSSSASSSCVVGGRCVSTLDGQEDCEERQQGGLALTHGAALQSLPSPRTRPPSAWEDNGIEENGLLSRAEDTSCSASTLSTRSAGTAPASSREFSGSEKRKTFGAENEHPRRFPVVGFLGESKRLRFGCCQERASAVTASGG